MSIDGHSRNVFVCRRTCQNPNDCDGFFRICDLLHGFLTMVRRRTLNLFGWLAVIIILADSPLDHLERYLSNLKTSNVVSDASKGRKGVS